MSHRSRVVTGLGGQRYTWSAPHSVSYPGPWHVLMQRLMDTQPMFHTTNRWPDTARLRVLGERVVIVMGREVTFSRRAMKVLYCGYKLECLIGYLQDLRKQVDSWCALADLAKGRER